MKDKKTKIRQEKIIELVSGFCDKNLNSEYEELCVKLIEKMGRKHDVPFKRGKLEIWASAVIYALGQINFLFDKTTEPYATPDDICNYFNTKKSTVSNKARDIREMFNMGHFDREFSLKELMESGIEEASVAIVEGKLAGIAASESLGYIPQAMAKELKDACWASLSELRSGERGEKLAAFKKEIMF